MLNPWLGIGAVLAALGGLAGALRAWQVRGGPHPELIRKLLHMGMGLVTLSFPWVFDAAWPVVLLAALAAFALLLLRLTSLGKVLTSVNRMSLGDVYFPIAVAILFVLYRREGHRPPDHRLVLYLVPILLLAIADAAAALIGVGYGKHQYLTSDGAKSAEGSVAFYACAFFCAHVPLLLLTNVGRPETLLIAILLAWLATMFEAISWRGLDNLALPLVSYLLLAAFLNMDVYYLSLRVGVTVLLMLFLYLYRARSTLLGSALLGAYLVGYVCWAVGGWRWLLAPAGLFLTYTRFSAKERWQPQQVHNIHAVVAVAAPGLLWLFLAQALFARPNDRLQMLLPFTINFAGHLAIAGIARLRCDYPKVRCVRLVSACIGIAWAIEFALFSFAVGLSLESVIESLIGLLGTIIIVLTFIAIQPGMSDCPIDTPRWIRQALAAIVGAVVGLAALNP